MATPPALLFSSLSATQSPIHRSCDRLGAKQCEHVHTQMNLVSTFRLRSCYWWAQSQNLRGIRNHSWTEPQALINSQDENRPPSPKPTQHMCPGKRSNRSLHITQQCTLPQQCRRTNSPNSLRTLCVWGPVGGTSELHNRRLTQFLFLGPRLFTSEMKSQQTLSPEYP